MFRFTTSVILLVTILGQTAWADDNPDLECRPMNMIYRDGKDLCERVFGNSFKYVPRSDPEYDLAYTMWFFDSANPNDATTQRRILAGKHREYNNTDVCHLRAIGTTDHMFPKPLPENSTFTECHPFRKNACCPESRVDSAEIINTLYGDEYRWDRCGKMAPECERFFVQEACMYECDPNPGLFRKNTPNEVKNDPSLEGEEWEIEYMPIQGDYCDAWFDACRYEKFCGDGDFFSCAKIPPVQYGPLSGGAIAGVVIGGIVLLATCCFVVILIRNERRGTPVFQKISAEDSRPLEKPAAATRGVANAPNDQVTTI